MWLKKVATTPSSLSRKPALTNSVNLALSAMWGGVRGKHKSCSQQTTCMVDPLFRRHSSLSSKPALSCSVNVAIWAIGWGGAKEGKNAWKARKLLSANLWGWPTPNPWVESLLWPALWMQPCHWSHSFHPLNWGLKAVWSALHQKAELLQA